MVASVRDGMSTGQVATLLRVTPYVVKELTAEMGLRPARTLRGWRVYLPQDVERIRLELTKRDNAQQQKDGGDA